MQNQGQGQQQTGTRNETYNIIAILYHALQGAENLIRRSRHHPWRVEIFHPDQPPPTLPVRVEPRRDRRDEAAEVQRAGRRWSESAGDGQRASVL